jgi:hypothetical protein
MRRILGVAWRRSWRDIKLTIENFYARCKVGPVIVQLVNACWTPRLLEHVLRINYNVPARQAMAC